MPPAAPPGAAGRVDALTAAAGGGWLARTAENGTVQVRDAVTDALRHTLVGHTDEVTALAAGPDGRWLATAGKDGTVRIWDPATGTSCHVLTDADTWITTLAVATGAGWLAAGDLEEQGAPVGPDACRLDIGHRLRTTSGSGARIVAVAPRTGDANTTI